MHMDSQPERKKAVLIVEDNAIAREGIGVVLRRAGYEFVAFPEGQQALDYLSANPPPDVILLDMMIPYPGIDGWRFLERRQRIPGADTIPVLIMTGLHVAGDEWAVSLGACGLIRKPVAEEDLWAEIRKYLPDQDKPSSVC